MDFSKEALRTEFKNKRLELSKSYVDKASKSICEKLINSFPVNADSVAAIYSPIHNEVDLTIYRDYLDKHNIKYCFPGLKDGEIIFCSQTNIQEEVPSFVKDPLHKLTNKEISEHQIIPFNEITTIIVPGICFTTENYRIGYGGGNYDKVLPKLEFARKLGVCYKDFLIEYYSLNKFDYPVHFVITD